MGQWKITAVHTQAVLHKQLKDFWSGVYQGNCAVNKFEIKNGNVSLIEEARYY